VANARGKRHTISVGWGIQVAKVCQIHFTNKGTLFVTFPYHEDASGVAARVKVVPGKTQYPLIDEVARTTSHKIKYSHPLDGAAHFSGDGKIFTEIWAEAAPALRGEVGHIFTLHLRGPDRFAEVSGNRELDDPSFHIFEFQSNEAPTCRLVGRFMPIPSQVNIDEPGKSVVPARFSDGTLVDLMVLAPPAGNPLDGHAVFLQCIPEDPLTRETDFHLSFQGGFGYGLADPSVESSMLVLNYPATDIDGFESMDYVPEVNL